jgi:hypothetical protein
MESICGFLNKRPNWKKPGDSTAVEPIWLGVLAVLLSIRSGGLGTFPFRPKFQILGLS